jgi:hypothetical protein
MARCAGCGKENQPDARFCKQCGRTLGAASTPADDDGPITVVPGQPAIAGTAAAEIPPSRGRNGLIIGLVLSGLAAVTAIGYFVGVRSGDAPAAKPTIAVEPAPAASTAPSLAAEVPVAPPATEAPAQKPAEEALPPKKSKRTEAARAKQAVQASPAAAAAPAAASDSAEQHWAAMRQELAACGKVNLVCHEKVRWRYCKGMWGKVPDCPQSSANAPTN